MALIDGEGLSGTQRSAAPPPFVSGAPIPHDSLARLPELRTEAEETVRLGRFLGHSVQAAGFLMLAGAAALLPGGGTLQSDFVWSLLVLAGIAAMTWNYVRGLASSPRRVRLETAAADLRAMLLYTGFAWGAGAFLALPETIAAPPALLFAAGPALMMLALLKDEAGVTAFTLPAALLSAAAALFKHWPDAVLVAPVILAAGIAIVAAAFLRRTRPAQRSPQNLPKAA